jgi:hypothetical protein
LTAELGLSGRAGDRAVRGRAIVGFERPASIRLEGVAPFGPPAFILAGKARAEDILGALTGVGLSPSDLLAVLTGCVASIPAPVAGRLHQNGWASIDVSFDTTVYLERVGPGWRPRAARRPGWQIEYPAWQGSFPQAVRLRSTEPAINVDLTATVSQLEANTTLDSSAFTISVPDDTLPLTLDELRDAGPLRAE